MKKSHLLNAWLFFGAVYGLSALLFAPILLSGRGIASPVNTILLALVTFVPSVMGIVFTYLTKNPDGRRDFWQRAWKWPHGKSRMAIAGLFVMPVITLASFLVASFISFGKVSFDYALEVLTQWKTLLIFLFVELTFGALSEELGWRGYVLDELQSRWGALKSSLVLGIIWALWHTPAFLIPGLSQYENGGLFSWTYISFLGTVTLGSVLHTWIYNNTQRSILVAGFLMHFTQNATLIFLGGIFERFSMPPAYWAVLPVVLVSAVTLVVFLYSPHTLAGKPNECLRRIKKNRTEFKEPQVIST